MIRLATDEALHAISAKSGRDIPWALLDDTTYVIEMDGEVVCAGGAPELWPGLGQSWAITLSDKITQPIRFTREAKKQLLKVMDDKGYRQVRGLSYRYDEVRWNKTLGFEIEGVWKQAGPNFEDVFVLVYHRRH